MLCGPLYFIFLKKRCHVFFSCVGLFDVRTNEALPTIKSSGMGPIYQGIRELKTWSPATKVPVFWNVYSRIKESRM